MSYTDFYADYLIPYVLLWLALAFAVGLIFGLLAGRRSALKSIHKLETPLTAPAVTTDDNRIPARPVPSARVNGLVDDEQEDKSAPDQADKYGLRAIDQLAGVDTRHIGKLKARGIHSLEQLLEATGKRGQKETLADDLQVEDFVLGKWVRMAELLGLPKMTPEIAEFLVFAGVNSVADLAGRNPESLQHKLTSLNDKEQRISVVPSRQQLEAWVEHIAANS